jgi:hypothetical protein
MNKIINWFLKYGGLLIVITAWIGGFIYHCGWMGLMILLGVVGVSIWATYGITKYVDYTIDKDKK